MSTKVINIGGASGFWGDSNMPVPQLLASETLDYLVFDYLAEITMSIMARARAKDPNTGYAIDFVTVVMKHALPEIARQGVKVISNAGGVNPVACGAALEALIDELGLDLKVATVTGDDILEEMEALRAAGAREMFSDEEMPESFMSANAYLGAFPVAEALGKGADIVITGRCVDSAVTLGACIHEFGWGADDTDQLAGGSLAGHIIECGAQASGGLFTDWEETGTWENIGYPIAGVSADGSFTVFKPEGTGGLVNRMTVAEQLVYEIGDPQAYILPDVVCDFSEVVVEDVSENVARVSGALGGVPTDTLKVSATWRDGFRVGTYLSIRGIDADRKAQKTADAVLKRVSGMLALRGLPGLTETSIEILGTEAGYGPHARIRSPREVVLKLAAKHPSPDVLAMLLRELTSSGTSMSPGTSGMGGNRAKPSPVVRLFSMLVPKATHPATVHFQGESWEVPFTAGANFDADSIERPQFDAADVSDEALVEVPLIRLAHGRSGDKGNDSNIGIIARDSKHYPLLLGCLTAESVREYFSYLMDGDVTRYELPGIFGVNFLLKESLGGGGIASLRNDPQAKAYAQQLLDMPVKIPQSIADSL